jgi:hypothetical protein
MTLKAAFSQTPSWHPSLHILLTVSTRGLSCFERVLSLAKKDEGNKNNGLALFHQ